MVSPVYSGDTMASRGPNNNGALCSVDGCNAKAGYSTPQPLCRKHWERWRKHGDPKKGARNVTKKVCVECGETSRKRMLKGAKGLCGPCYMRKRRHGDPSILLRPQNREIKICSVNGCNNKHDSFGYCRTHSVRFAKYGDPLAYSPTASHLRKTDRTQKCKVDWCDKEIGSGSNGMCSRCYQREKIRQHPERYRAYCNSRRRRVRKATPPWADMEKIREIYRNCPEGHEVDHIIPLKGVKISGLHVPDNLQYLPVSENRTKSNKVLAT